MKQLTCPRCAAVLDCPAGSGVYTITCTLCGQTLRVSVLGASSRKAPALAGAATVPAYRPAVSSPPVAPRPARAPLPAAPAGPTTLRAAPRTQARRAPAPAVQLGRTPWLGIAALALLLVIAGGVVYLVLHQRKPVEPVIVQEDPKKDDKQDDKKDDKKDDRRDPRPDTDPEPVPEPTGPATEAQVREVVLIDSKGDATVRRYYQFAAMDYNAIKSAVTRRSTGRLLQELGLRKHWQEIHDFHVECSDALRAVVVRWGVRGLARMGDGQLWEAPLADEQGLSLLSSHDNEGIFTGTRELQLLGASDLLPLTRIVRGPRGSSTVQLLPSPARVGFRMPASDAGAAGAAGTPRFELQAKANLMSCAARVYGQRKFGRFWTARSVFKNGSGQALHDYSVRFRLGDYASGWQAFACPVVLPGQTVVDAYYPVLDNDRLVRLTDAAQATLEVEYQYRQADGQTVHKVDSRVVRVLDRNQVFNTSLAQHECEDFRDQREDKLEVLATLVASSDPVIKELEGRVVAGLIKRGIEDDPVKMINRPADPKNPQPPANGLSTSDDPVDAYLLAKGLYYFMSRYIAYNHPPGDNFDELHSQVVMYGRDVLKHHAGTCIDLAILYASVCSAGGMDVSLILIQGHCYPVIRLPRPIIVPLFDNQGRLQRNKEGKLTFVKLQEIGVEATLIKSRPFEAALMYGTQEWQESQEKGPYLRVRVNRDHARGIRPLSLPAISLKDCDINEDGSWAQDIPGPRGGQSQGGQSQGGQSPGEREGGSQNKPTAVVGRWHATGRAPNGTNYEAKITFTKDGSFKYVDVQYRLLANGVTVPVAKVVFTGSYKVAATTITFTTDEGQEIVWRYQMPTNDRLIGIPLHAAARGMGYDYHRLE